MIKTVDNRAKPAILRWIEVKGGETAMARGNVYLKRHDATALCLNTGVIFSSTAMTDVSFELVSVEIHVK